MHLVLYTRDLYVSRNTRHYRLTDYYTVGDRGEKEEGEEGNGRGIGLLSIDRIINVTRRAELETSLSRYHNVILNSVNYSVLLIM